jgi:hypothetical protein
MDSAIRNLRIETYRSQLAVCDCVREALSKELENANLNRDQRLAIGRRCDEARKEARALQLMLDLMERRDAEAKITPLRRIA